MQVLPDPRAYPSAIILRKPLLMRRLVFFPAVAFGALFCCLYVTGTDHHTPD